MSASSSSVLSLFMSLNQHNSQTTLNEGTIIKEGWIFKKSCIATQYKKRWMVLKGTKLSCYLSPNISNNNDKVQTFNLSLYRFKVERHSKSPFKFYLINESVTNGSNNITFKTLKDKDCDKWVFKIQEAIISCNLSKYRGSAPLYSTFESAIADNDSDDNNDESESDSDDTKASESSFDGFRIRSITISEVKQMHPICEDTDDDDIDANNDNEEYENKMEMTLKLPQQNKLNVNMTPNANDNMKRQFIEKEIIETEKTYYHGIAALLNELLIPMFENKIIDETKYFAKITSSIPNLVAFHELLLEQLTEAYEYSTDAVNVNANNLSPMTPMTPMILTPIPDDDKYKSIAQVFNAQNKEEFVSIYIKFISEYKTILDLFGVTFHDNKRLQIFLREKRKNMKPLSNYLILPVQRVPRYVLLLKDLKKNTNENYSDYKDIECALELVEEIAYQINERKRKIENLSQCLQIQQCLTNLTETIVDQKRKFEKQFVFVKKENKHQRQFFVFSDMIIIANKTWSVKEMIKNIRTVEIKYDENNKDNIFTLIYGNNICLYIAESLTDITEFEHIIKQNRLKLMDYDIAHIKGVGSIKDIRKQIKKQKDVNSNEFKLKQTQNLKLISLIRRVYQEYQEQKGKPPTNSQSFLRFCKNTKKIKNAKYSVCDQVIKEMQQNL